MALTKNLLAGATAMALLSLAPMAQAATVTLDNSPGSDAATPFGVGGTQTYGEVFTAPITGTLTSFTLQLTGGVGDLYAGVDSWNGSAAYGLGFGSSGSLYQSADTPSSSGGPYTFTPNIAVTAGQQYVAFLSTWGDDSATSQSGMPLSVNAVSGLDYFVFNNGSGPHSDSWDYFFDAASIGYPGGAQFSHGCQRRRS